MTDFFKDIKNILSELTEEIHDFQDNLERVQTETQKAERVSQDIQRKVNEFNVSIQPRLDKINAIVEKMNSNQKADSN